MSSSRARDLPERDDAAAAGRDPARAPDRLPGCTYASMFRVSCVDGKCKDEVARFRSCPGRPRERAVRDPHSQEVRWMPDAEVERQTTQQREQNEPDFALHVQLPAMYATFREEFVPAMERVASTIQRDPFFGRLFQTPQQMREESTGARMPATSQQTEQRLEESVHEEPFEPAVTVTKSSVSREGWLLPRTARSIDNPWPLFAYSQPLNAVRVREVPIADGFTRDADPTRSAQPPLVVHAAPIADADAEDERQVVSPSKIIADKLHHLADKFHHPRDKLSRPHSPDSSSSPQTDRQRKASD